MKACFDGTLMDFDDRHLLFVQLLAYSNWNSLRSEPAVEHDRSLLKAGLQLEEEEL